MGTSCSPRTRRGAALLCLVVMLGASALALAAPETRARRVRRIFERHDHVSLINDAVHPTLRKGLEGKLRLGDTRVERSGPLTVVLHKNGDRYAVFELDGRLSLNVSRTRRGVEHSKLLTFEHGKLTELKVSYKKGNVTVERTLERRSGDTISESRFIKRELPDGVTVRLDKGQHAGFSVRDERGNSLSRWYEGKAMLLRAQPYIDNPLQALFDKLAPAPGSE
ncbi:MAG: hypothetical protein KC503_26535 [Myxococcales bacterium]|nr:hypothetical protein [Myxococcales bacterium]